MSRASLQAVQKMKTILSKYHFQLVFLLSLLHIGLACVHSWDSGSTDSLHATGLHS